MHEYWFSPRILGFGFGLPQTVEGWLAFLGLFITIALSAYVNEIFNKENRKGWRSLSSKKGARFLLDLIIIMAIFIALFGDRVEGGMVWHFLN